MPNLAIRGYAALTLGDHYNENRRLKAVESSDLAEAFRIILCGGHDVRR